MAYKNMLVSLTLPKLWLFVENTQRPTSNTSIRASYYSQKPRDVKP